MRKLEGKEEEEAKRYMQQAADIAKSATCSRSRCGSMIVKEDKIIGQGFNSPPGEKDSQKRCDASKDSYHKKVTDKTCCIHAEQRAIMDALRNNPSALQDSVLYFIRLDKDELLQGNYEITDSGRCFHIKLHIAAFPSRRLEALKVIEKLLKP